MRKSIWRRPRRKKKCWFGKTHQTLKRVTNDFDVRWHFNTSVALMMELVNELQAQEPLDADVSPVILKRVLSVLALMLSPMTPHICRRTVGNAGYSRTACTNKKWPAIAKT